MTQINRRLRRTQDGPLTDREMEVLALLADCLTNAEIAARLVIDVKTVEAHVYHMRDRLGLQDEQLGGRMRILLAALERGLVPPGLLLGRAAEIGRAMLSWQALPTGVPFLTAPAPRLNAVDMSRWGGELTAAEADGLLDAGVRLVIVGTGDAHPTGAGEWARQQASMWLARTAAKGGQVDAYVYLLFAGDPTYQVHIALETMAGIPIRRWWLDAEDVASPQLTPALREAFLDLCLMAMGSGLAKGIYSGRWWWVPNMANSTRFASLPLWNSYYDGDPDVDGLPYGGWTADDVAIEQFEGTTDLAGQSVDLNFARDLEEDEMTQDDRDRITRLETRQARLERIVAGNGVDVVAETPAQLEDLRQVLGADAELGKVYRLAGDVALAWLDADEASLELGLEGAEQRISELEAGRG